MIGKYGRFITFNGDTYMVRVPGFKQLHSTCYESAVEKRDNLCKQLDIDPYKENYHQIHKVCHCDKISNLPVRWSINVQNKKSGTYTHLLYSDHQRKVRKSLSINKRSLKQAYLEIQAYLRTKGIATPEWKDEFSN